ncbi:hypothetical protein [Teichococcus vastitatis]|uniref:hypothetical protein n=1 Tax=Teichococcus vastitatis TaxID=2307076 RepID=UPI00130031C7|nr:hypothetical protein [Pseudoroseomonas vastitatis]
MEAMRTTSRPLIWIVDPRCNEEDGMWAFSRPRFGGLPRHLSERPSGLNLDRIHAGLLEAR